MIWLIAHTPDGLQPETFRAVMDWVPPDETVRFHDVGGDDFEYGRILADLWSKHRGLVVVEQDIVIRPDVVTAFMDCQHPYCCFPYAWRSNVGPALGCTRFRREFTHEHADAMERALLEPAGYGAGHYRSVDIALMRYVLARDLLLQPHVHLPAVEHLNEKQALAPSGNPDPLLEVPLW